jgi:hypothetical protein
MRWAQQSACVIGAAKEFAMFFCSFAFIGGSVNSNDRMGFNSSSPLNSRSRKGSKNSETYQRKSIEV